jgi:nucleoid DNA-binding protein
MTRADLIETISEKLNEPKKNVTPIMEEVFNSIKSVLVKREKCTSVGFALFEVKDRVARESRNPQGPSKFPQRKSLYFVPARV